MIAVAITSISAARAEDEVQDVILTPTDHVRVYTRPEGPEDGKVLNMTVRDQHRAKGKIPGVSGWSVETGGSCMAREEGEWIFGISRCGGDCSEDLGIAFRGTPSPDAGSQFVTTLTGEISSCSMGGGSGSGNGGSNRKTFTVLLTDEDRVFVEPNPAFATRSEWKRLKAFRWVSRTDQEDVEVRWILDVANPLYMSTEADGMNRVGNDYTHRETEMWFMENKFGEYTLKAYAGPSPMLVPFTVTDEMWHLIAYPQHVPIDEDGNLNDYHASVFIHTYLIEGGVDLIELEFRKDGVLTDAIVAGDKVAWNINRSFPNAVRDSVSGSRGYCIPLVAKEPGDYTAKITAVKNSVGESIPAFAGVEFSFTAVGSRLVFDAEDVFELELTGGNVQLLPLRSWPEENQTDVNDVGVSIRGELALVPESGYSSSIQLKPFASASYGFTDSSETEFIKAVGVEPGSATHIDYETLQEGEGGIHEDAAVRLKATYTVNPVRLGSYREGNVTKDYYRVPTADTASESVNKTACSRIMADTMVCADFDIENVPGGQTVFDLAENPGKCEFTVEGNDFAALSDDTASAIWDVLEWHLPDVGIVEPAYEDVEGEQHKKLIKLAKMPINNDAFGEKRLKLWFEGRHAWAVNEDVTFRFRKSGTAASTQHHEVLGEHVNNGDPNWYVYWQQAAHKEGEDGYDFRPEIKMVYKGASDDQGLGAYSYEWIGNTWTENGIFIYEGTSVSIVEFIKTIHHENGHRDSKQLGSEFGGWGEELNYTENHDLPDKDGVHNDWEEGMEGFDPENHDGDLRYAWEHGWDSIADHEAAGHAVNPEGWDPETNQGLCAKREKEVQDKEDENNSISKQDWSIAP